VGCPVGSLVGSLVGFLVGSLVGLNVGFLVGSSVGFLVGSGVCPSMPPMRQEKIQTDITNEFVIFMA